MEEGFGVDMAAGSDPLPFYPALQGGKLRALDFEGATIFERELPDYPDIEDIKTRLAADIEEPAVVHWRSGSLVLFTAAGIYAFSLPEDTRPGAVDPAAVRVLWYRTWSHAFGTLASSGRAIMLRSASMPGQGNPFPHVEFEANGDPRVLHPDGELYAIDRRTGKLRWRYDEGGYDVVGDPVEKDGGFYVRSASPPGILIYETTSDGPSTRYLEAPDKAWFGYHLPGVASAFYSGSKLTVRDAVTGFDAWTRSTSSVPIRLTADTIWTSGAGNIRIKSVRSGRVLRQIDLPDNTRVAALYEEPGFDDDGPMLVTSRAYGMAATEFGPVRGGTSGTGLRVVRLDGDMNIVWDRPIATGVVRFDGRRRILADGRALFAFNEQEEETEKWYTRVMAVSRKTGRVQSWIRTAISGQGTGQAARVAMVGDGLALGNVDGFGWFLPPAPETEGDGDPEAGDPTDGDSAEPPNPNEGTEDE